MKTPRKSLTKRSVVRALGRLRACKYDRRWFHAARGRPEDIWNALWTRPSSGAQRRRCWVLWELGLHNDRGEPDAVCTAARVDFQDVRAAALRQGWWR